MRKAMRLAANPSSNSRLSELSLQFHTHLGKFYNNRAPLPVGISIGLGALFVIPEILDKQPEALQGYGCADARAFLQLTIDG